MKRFSILLFVALVAGCTVSDIANLFPGGGAKAPFPSPEGLSVLVIEDPNPEARARLTPTQQEILNVEGPVLKWCRENCAKVNGVPECRVVSPNNKMERESAKWQAAVRVTHPELPVVVAANKNRGLVARIEQNTPSDAVLKALQSVKGK